MKKIKIPSPKGNIAAVLHYPKNKTDKLAILCPGYLDSKDYNHLKTLAEDLTKLGYTAIRFDPIGTWKSDGNISDYTTTEYLKDVKEVLEYMLRKNNFKQILIGGHSRGGGISILYAARDKRVSEIIGIMASSVMSKNDDRVIEAKRMGFSISHRDLPEDRNRKIEFKVPYSHFEDNLKYNGLKEIKEIKVPIILIAGELDKMVPAEKVKRIFDNANEPKKFILIPGIGHNYRKYSLQIKLVNNEIIKALVGHN